MAVDPTEVGLPPRPFLYYHDQIETLLSMTRQQVRSRSWYEGASIHLHEPHQMKWMNLGDKANPVWRISEQEFVRWCKRVGIKVRTSTWAR